MSVRKAAEPLSEEFAVPKLTFSDRVTGQVKPGSIWGKTSKLSAVDGTALVQAAITRADKGIGLSKGTFLRYVVIFQSAKPNRNMKKDCFVITASEVYQQKVNKEDEKKEMLLSKYCAELKERRKRN